MTTHAAINKQGHNDVTFVAGFEGVKIGLWAASLAQAKQRAVEHFRPNKRKASLVWLERAEPEEGDA